MLSVAYLTTTVVHKNEVHNTAMKLESLNLNKIPKSRHKYPIISFQVLLYDIPKMLSNFGGTLGMYVGISLLGVANNVIDKIRAKFFK